MEGGACKLRVTCFRRSVIVMYPDCDRVIRDSQNADCGYPWAVELNDGRVLVVYYYSYPDGPCGIEGTVIEES